MKNIFDTNNKTVSSNNNLVFESTDFCFETALLDIMYWADNEEYKINENHVSSVYIGLKDKSIEILQEGLSDFKDSAVEFFKKFIEKLKNFFKRVLMFLNSYIGSFDKFIRKYGSELGKKNIKFSIMGYKYTISSTVPDTSFLEKLASEYNNELSGLSNMTKGDIVKKRKEIMDESNLNSIRGKIMESNTDISEDEFKDEIQKIFRNGDKEEILIDIDSSYINSIINDYDYLKKQYNETRKQRDKMINELDKLKKFFEKGASFEYLSGKKTLTANRLDKEKSKIEMEYSNNNVLLANTFFNFKLAYAKKISSMYSIVVTEKANALKSQIGQYKKILRKVITSREEDD